MALAPHARRARRAPRGRWPRRRSTAALMRRLRQGRRRPRGRHRRGRRSRQTCRSWRRPGERSTTSPGSASVGGHGERPRPCVAARWAGTRPATSALQRVGRSRRSAPPRGSAARDRVGERAVVEALARPPAISTTGAGAKASSAAMAASGIVACESFTHAHAVARPPALEPMRHAARSARIALRDRRVGIAPARRARQRRGQHVGSMWRPGSGTRRPAHRARRGPSPAVVEDAARRIASSSAVPAQVARTGARAKRRGSRGRRRSGPRSRAAAQLGQARLHGPVRLDASRAGRGGRRRCWCRPRCRPRARCVGSCSSESSSTAQSSGPSSSASSISGVPDVPAHARAACLPPPRSRR